MLAFDPENIVLSHVSYMFFGFFPGYYSDARMEPLLETRLLDARSLSIIANGASDLPGPSAPKFFTRDISWTADGIAQSEISMKAGETLVFHFDFLGREPHGQLQILGPSLERLYALPSSGREKSFGSGPRNGREISVQNRSDQPELIKLRFVPDSFVGNRDGASGPFASVKIEHFESSGHVIELRSLLPFSAVVHAPNNAILETPRVDVPGYTATVNGTNVAIIRTGEGLVGVPVPAGTSEVRVEYQGTKTLRITYGLSAASWMAFGLCLVGLTMTGGSEAMRGLTRSLDELVSRHVATMLAVVAAGIILAISGAHLWRWMTAPVSGTLRMLVMLPAGNEGEVEPLLTTGVTGRGDVIYLKYLGGNRVSVGYDHWGYGGDSSAPFEVDFSRPQTIAITMKSLARRNLWGLRVSDAGPHGVHVTWNGREIISTTVDSYPSGNLEIGANSIGASSCGLRFFGDVLDVSSVSGGPL